MMVCLSCWLFGTTLNSVNVLGVGLVVAGSTWYSSAAGSQAVTKAVTPTAPQPEEETLLPPVKIVSIQ